MLHNNNALLCRWCKDWFPRDLCGADGQTYGSMCHLRCAGVRLLHEGRCKTPCGSCELDECGCDDAEEPACGSDNRTYMNVCYLKCQRVKVVSNQPCGSGFVHQQNYNKYWDLNPFN